MRHSHDGAERDIAEGFFEICGLTDFECHEEPEDAPSTVATAPLTRATHQGVANCTRHSFGRPRRPDTRALSVFLTVLTDQEVLKCLEHLGEPDLRRVAQTNSLLARLRHVWPLRCQRNPSACRIGWSCAVRSACSTASWPFRGGFRKPGGLANAAVSCHLPTACLFGSRCRLKSRPARLAQHACEGRCVRCAASIGGSRRRDARGRLHRGGGSARRRAGDVPRVEPR